MANIEQNRKLMVENIKKVRAQLSEAGVGESKELKKVRKLANKYGYVEVKDAEKYAKKNGIDTEGITYTALFIDPKDKNKDTYVGIYPDEDGDLQVTWYYWGGPSGNDSIEDWTLNSTWKDMVK